MPEQIKLRVRDCACPETPHDGHHVFMTPTLPFAAGYHAERAAIQNAGGDANALQLAWLEVFVRYGAVGWDLCDAEGEPVPFDIEAVLADYTLSRPVAEKAGDLGWDHQVLDPLLASLPKPSRTGQTGASTSRTRRRTPTPSE